MPEDFRKGRLKIKREDPGHTGLNPISGAIEKAWVIPSQRWHGFLFENQLHAETKQKVRLLLHRETKLILGPKI